MRKTKVIFKNLLMCALIFLSHQKDSNPGLFASFSSEPTTTACTRWKMLTHLLSVSDLQQDDLERLRLEHDVLDDVVGQAVDVDLGQARLAELLLDVGDLVFQRPHLADRLLHDLLEEIRMGAFEQWQSFVFSEFKPKNIHRVPLLTVGTFFALARLG